MQKGQEKKGSGEGQSGLNPGCFWVENMGHLGPKVEQKPLDSKGFLVQIQSSLSRIKSN